MNWQRCDELTDLLARFVRSGLADAELDLSQVTRFGPEALSFLVELRRICASQSGVVTLTNPNQRDNPRETCGTSDKRAGQIR